MYDSLQEKYDKLLKSMGKEGENEFAVPENAAFEDEMRAESEEITRIQNGDFPKGRLNKKYRRGRDHAPNHASVLEDEGDDDVKKKEEANEDDNQ